MQFLFKPYLSNGLLCANNYARNKDNDVEKERISGTPRLGTISGDKRANMYTDIMLPQPMHTSPFV